MIADIVNLVLSSSAFSKEIKKAMDNLPHDLAIPNLNGVFVNYSFNGVRFTKENMVIKLNSEFYKAPKSISNLPLPAPFADIPFT